MEIQSTPKPCKRRIFTGSTISDPEGGGGGGGQDDGSLLPEWFLIEVLCRLPMDALFRFKCVSKQCLSFITDPSFPRLYHFRATALGMPRCKLAFLEPKLRAQIPKMSPHLPEHENHDLISPEPYFLTLPPSTTEEKSYYIKAVDKGFILYHMSSAGYMDAGAQYYICNPLTKQGFPLPTRSNYFEDISVGFITRVEDGNLSSFRVVVLPCLRTKQNFLEFQVFSSETGEWKGFSVYCEARVQVSSIRRPAVLNNILHWIDCELGIVAYDPYNSPDKFRIIQFPDDARRGYNLDYYFSKTTKCGVCQGRLKYFEIIDLIPPESSTLKIWELQDYSGDQWRLQHSTRGGDLVAPCKLRGYVFKFATLVSFHPSDPNVVYMCLGGDSDLVVYNMMSTRRAEPLGFQSKYDKDDFDDLRWRDIVDWSGCFPLGPIGIPSSPGIEACW